VTPPGPPGFDAVSAVRRPLFNGTGGTLFGIHIVNMFLTLATLPIYYFWAKTRVRQYIWSQTQIERDPFEYHGTGMELLLGWLKAVLVFFLPLVLLTVVRDVLEVHPVLKGVAGVMIPVIVVIFVPVAMVGARRYRLSRTSWRGIRFSFRGEARAFVWIFVKGMLLAAVTLGLYYPYFLTAQRAFMIRHSYFGNERFDFIGRGRDLFGSYVLALVLTPFTLGLCWFWFVAKKRRLFWGHTLFGTARFRCTVTGGALLGLQFVNVLLLVFTQGLAWPWVKVRNIDFAFRYLTLEGPLDLARIQQQAQFATATGEGLAGFLDSGFDVG
jgi:uncharacterized membrane protein YjgN (DUF898 family)